MPIFEVTYVSNDIPVNGYLAVPAYILSNADELLYQLRQRYGDSPQVKVHTVVESDPPPYLPVARFTGPLPAFVYCRGGIGRVGMAKLDWIETFLSHQCVVFAPWYRGTFGSPGRDQFGGDDCEDVDEAVRLLQGLPFVSDQITVMGFSRGSVNATKTAVSVPGVSRLVLWGGVSDLAKTYEERIDLRRMLKRVVGGSVYKLPDEYARRSPITYVDDISCRTLIIHGTRDEQVDVHHGLDMYAKLKLAGKQVDLHCYEGYGHHLDPLVFEAVVARMFSWLSRSPAGG